MKPVVCRDENRKKPTAVCSEQTTHPRSSREGQNFILEEETNHDRTVKPVVCRDVKKRAVNVKRGWHWLQNTRIATFCCETSWEFSCSWAGRSGRGHNLFNEIYNKTKPTTRSVRRQRKWFRKWATWSCLNCARWNLRRSAKNAYHTGAKASSIAHAGISWKKVQPTEASSTAHWTFSQFQTTLLRGATSWPQMWENFTKERISSSP